jgi:hypothetical protein
MIKSVTFRWTGHVARMWEGEEEGPCRILVRKKEGMIPLGGCRRRWMNNIITDPRGIDRVLWTDFIWLNMWFL